AECWSWKLQLTVDLPGVDFSRHYPITVLPVQPGTVPTAEPALKPLSQIRQEQEERESDSETRSADSSPLWVLVGANLVPIAGALFWGWAVQDIVFLYWMENLVIGVFNILRILAAEPDQTELAKRGLEVTDVGSMLLAKGVLAAFFLVHYGAFCFA